MTRAVGLLRSSRIFGVQILATWLACDSALYEMFAYIAGANQF